MVFRAYFAIPGNLSTRSGLPTNAIFGFTNMFRKLLTGKVPDLAAVVFDPPGPSFRSERFPDYKAQRPRMADDLAVQLPWIDKVVEAHRFPILRVPGFEADDVIGTLTRQAVERGMEVHIISADKDFAQLISDQVRMIDAMRDINYDPELVRKKWGVPPHQFIDYLALIGDKVDNIPGVPGVGAKTASKLLDDFGNLEAILASTDKLKGKVKNNLEEFAEQARLSRELATIDCQVELPLTLDSLAYQPPSQDDLNELYRELEFFSLLGVEAKDEQAREEAGDTDYRVIDSVEALAKALNALRCPALWPVLDSPSPVRGPWLGVAFSDRPGSGFYVPITDWSRQPLFDYLAGSAPKLAHDAKVLMVLAKGQGFELGPVVGDTRLASFLIDPTGCIPHDLERVCKEYLHRVLRPIKSLVGSGKSQKLLAELELAELGDYACHLADAVGQLWPILKAKANPEHLAQELELSTVLAAMEFKGVLVDQPDLAALGREFHQKLADLEKTIHDLAGRSFNIGSPKQLSDVLFDELKLPVIKRTKTGYSTNAEVLERLASEHEIARHLLEYRKLEKLINTYVDVLARELNPDTGRIHTTFQQTAGATGRLITAEPDLQRTPVKTDEGRRIRHAFVARPATTFVVADWSQIELRVMAHFSKDPALVEAFAHDLDIHRRTASQLFDCSVDEVTKPQREIAKTVNFATIYGQGATALGQILGIPRKEAQEYIDRYFRSYAGVRTWLDTTIEYARADGWVATLTGRRRYIPELFSKNFMDRQAGERIAANTPIQGSAADICKLAMLGINRQFKERGLKTDMLLQIHDELIFEAPPEEVETVLEVVKHQMEHVVQLEVPLKAELGVGPNWAEAKA